MDVVVADGSYQCLKPIRMDGIKVYYGEILSEHAEFELEDEHLSYLLSATDNHYYNALVCKAQGPKFGHHRTFQLAPHRESSQEQKRLTLQQRGYFAFEPPTDYYTLHQLLNDGWTVQTTCLSEKFDLDQLKNRLGELGKSWLLLGIVSPQGRLQLYSREQPFKSAADWTLLYFAPERQNTAPAGRAA
ncbi:MAG TPA: hypothetical protein ENN06_11085 [Desulfobacteraceae bacterium]|nr:hypothetical protein [Desulfobacteraceae bacterium]